MQLNNRLVWIQKHQAVSLASRIKPCMSMCEHKKSLLDSMTQWQEARAGNHALPFLCQMITSRGIMTRISLWQLSVVTNSLMSTSFMEFVSLMLSICMIVKKLIPRTTWNPSLVRHMTLFAKVQYLSMTNSRWNHTTNSRWSTRSFTRNWWRTSYQTLSKW